jgi:protein phosphatase 1G
VQQDLTHVEVGIGSQQGWRKTQEDAHVWAQLDEKTLVFGVFDGHGGGEVSKFCAEHIHVEIEKMPEYEKGEFGESLVAVFHRMDDMMQTPEGLSRLRALRDDPGSQMAGHGDDQEEEGSFDFLRSLLAQQNAQRGATEANRGQPDHMEEIQAGCTAVVALVKGNKLYVANAGDSRAVMSRRGKAIPLSFDHKPSHPAERQRIESAGGFVSNLGGMSRVNGNLNLSRAIGDLKYKGNKDLHAKHQIITAEPDIEEADIQEGDEFLLLACDGIWDVLTNQEAIDFVRKGLEEGKSCSEVACDVLDRCIATDPKESRGIGCDNMTCCVVRFKDEFHKGK